MEKERNLNYWTIRKFSLLYSYYAIIDTTDYCRVANESTPAHSAALHNQLLSLRAAAEKLSL